MWDSWLGNTGNHHLSVLYVVTTRQDPELDSLSFKAVNKFSFYTKVA